MTLVVRILFLAFSIHEVCQLIFLPFQGKFPSFYQYMKCFNSDNFNYDILKQKDEFVFMRWKEQFLVPNHKVSISMHVVSQQTCSCAATGNYIMGQVALIIYLHAFTFDLN